MLRFLFPTNRGCENIVSDLGPYSFLAEVKRYLSIVVVILVVSSHTQTHTESGQLALSFSLLLERELADWKACRLVCPATLDWLIFCFYGSLFFSLPECAADTSQHTLMISSEESPCDIRRDHIFRLGPLRHELPQSFPDRLMVTCGGRSN